MESLYVGYTLGGILRFLKTSLGASNTQVSPSKSLLFAKGSELEVVGYTDADSAGDQSHRRSTSGYFIFVGGNLVT